MSIRIDNQQLYIDHNDSSDDIFVDDLTLNNLTVKGSLTGADSTIIGDFSNPWLMAHISTLDANTLGHTLVYDIETSVFDTKNASSSNSYLRLMKRDENGGFSSENLTDDGTDIHITSDLKLGDNNDILIGASNDFRFYHDGMNSYIRNVTGDLTIECTSNLLFIEGANTQ